MSQLGIKDPISTKDAATELKVTPNQVGVLCRKGTLKAELFAGVWFVSAESVRAYKKVQATQPVRGWKARDL